MHIVCGLLAMAWTALAISAGRVASPDESWHGDPMDRWIGATWLAASLCYTIVLLVSHLITSRLFRWRTDYLTPAVATFSYLAFATNSSVPTGLQIDQIVGALPWIGVFGLDGSALAGYLIPLAFGAWILRTRQRDEVKPQQAQATTA